jgi:hypothetical protein
MGQTENKKWIEKSAYDNYFIRYDSLQQENALFRAIHEKQRQQIREQNQQIAAIIKEVERIKITYEAQKLHQKAENQLYKNEIHRQQVIITGLKEELEDKHFHITLSKDAKIGYLALAMTFTSVTIMAIIVATR